jgi:hypothetical protein
MPTQQGMCKSIGYLDSIFSFGKKKKETHIRTYEDMFSLPWLALLDPTDSLYNSYGAQTKSYELRYYYLRRQEAVSHPSSCSVALYLSHVVPLGVKPPGPPQFSICSSIILSQCNTSM